MEAAAAAWLRRLAATDLGRPVVLTETGSWLGGQLTSQAVPPDEHPWVEITGTTGRYRQLRDAVRTRYKRTRRLTETAMRDPLFNPGRGLGEQAERGAGGLS